MTRKLLLAVALSALAGLGSASVAEAAPTQLLLSQSAAFSILGHWCGGIQERAYATGFKSITGNPVGDVYMSTRCGGSGRGGGYHSTTYSAWVSVTWSYAGATVSYAKLGTAPAVNPTFSAYDAHRDEVYNQNSQAYVVVVVPAAPTNVSATRSSGRFRVLWTPDPTAPPALITSSTVRAAPVASTASVMTATVTVAGNGARALIGPLQPRTTYKITVVSTDAAGPSASSAAVSVTTGASSMPPGATTGLSAYWTAPGSPNDALVASWKGAPQGDSPTDEYTVEISGSDGGGTFTRTVSGSMLRASFAVSDVPDWTIQVRAHNAAGWGPWSARYTLGGV